MNLFTPHKQASRSLGLLLIALMMFVVGMQCCHTLLAAAPGSESLLTCHNQTDSARHMTMPQAHQSEAQAHQRDRSEPTDPSCHCEANPSQLSWNHQNDSGQIDLLKPVSLYLQPFQIASIQEQTLKTPIRFLHPPPYSGRPLFITSTILLI